MRSHKQLATAINSINTKRASLVELVQNIGVEVIEHAHVHGDYTLCNQLAAAVGNGMKAQALRLWLIQFAPVKLADKGDDVFTFAKNKRKEGDELAGNMMDAKAKAWWDYKTETDAATFDFRAGLAALLKKIDATDTSALSAEEKQAIDNLHTIGRAFPKVAKPKAKAVAP